MPKIPLKNKEQLLFENSFDKFFEFKFDEAISILSELI